MDKKLYCQVGGKNREVLRNLVLPFPEKFHDKLEPPYPEDTPVLVDGRVIMKANISIAILAEGVKLSLDVWVSVSQEAVKESFHVKERLPRENVRGMEGILESRLPFHPKSSGLKIYVSMVGSSLESKFPSVTILSESDLKNDQINGVSMPKVCNWMSSLYLGKAKLE